MLKSKIHRVTVTEADLNYVGSITLDPELLEAAEILEYEQVHVLDVDNGNRLTTYALAGVRGSGECCINGAAARLVNPGDVVLVLTYSDYSEEEARGVRPIVVHVDERNRIKRIDQPVEHFGVVDHWTVFN